MLHIKRVSRFDMIYRIIQVAGNPVNDISGTQFSTSTMYRIYFVSTTLIVYIHYRPRRPWYWQMGQLQT